MRFLSEVAEVKLTGDQRGRGVFATSRIELNEHLALAEDFQLLPADEVANLPAQMAVLCYDYELGETLNVCPADFHSPAMSFLMNHSCAPNTASDDNWDTLIALRPIEVGEELTCDYATADSDSDPRWNFRCHCRASNCRGHITGNDWMIPELQERYRGYFQKNIQDKIDALKRKR